MENQQPKTRKKQQTISIKFDVEYDEIEWDGGYIPKTVYKYRDWENANHRKILEEKSIWVPDSFDFNDPFDCNIPIAYDLLMNDDALAEKYIRRLIQNSKTISPNDIEAEIQKRFAEKKYKDPIFLKKLKDEMHSSARMTHGIFSVTPINNNILMWSHYANSHKGLCIGFDSEKLFKFLGGGGHVNYSEKYPIISPTDEHEKQYAYQFFTKSHHWEYEIEYRLTAFQKYNVNIAITPDVISEVVFGANMKNEHKTEVKKILKNSLPHVKCFSAVQDRNNFKLNIVQESNQ